MALVASPIELPYFLMAEPAAKSFSAILCPGGMSLSATRLALSLVCTQSPARSPSIATPTSSPGCSTSKFKDPPRGVVLTDRPVGGRSLVDRLVPPQFPPHWRWREAFGRALRPPLRGTHPSKQRWRRSQSNS